MQRLSCRLGPLAFILGLALAFVLLPRGGTAAEARLTFSGGPDGGTFRVFSRAMSDQLSQERTIEVFDVSSAGSVENICRIQAGDADFAIAYAGDALLARNGQMPRDHRQYSNIRVLAFLYGAPAHLVTLADRNIDGLADLRGKRIAVGGAGSGAAATARRYLNALGLWETMKVDYIGYSKAALALAEGRIDAFWVLAGAPNTAVTQAASGSQIKILDTWLVGSAAGFFDEHPFYSPVTIPAGTYPGIDYPVQTFEDSALWVAGKHVTAQHVRRALERIFSGEGLASLARHKGRVDTWPPPPSLMGIGLPLHQGAEQYWKSKNLAPLKFGQTMYPSSGQGLTPVQ